MSFPKYPDYRASGYDWLGDVPAHWRVEKFRHHFSESSEKIDDDVVGPMLSVSGYRGIEVKEYDDDNQKRTDDELVGYRIVRPGQLVVNTMWLNYAGLGVSSHEGHVSPAYRCYWIDPRLDKRFVHHLMRSSRYVIGYTKYLTGIRPNSLQMSREDLMVFPVLIPPTHEQTAIAAFLDRETAMIDALVAEQEKLIALLKEKRQAVISHAVTKGLDPTAPMKVSGVEWLGEMPSHWGIVPIKYLAAVGNGSTPNRDRLDYWDGGNYPWLSSTVVNQDVVQEAEEFVTQLALKECHLPVIQPPAVLIGITGQGKTRGMASILGVEATMNQHVAYVKPRAAHISVHFLHRYFEMAYEQMRFESEGAGSTKGAITCEQISNMRVPCPPDEEQDAIITYLDREMQKLDALIVECQGAIALLQERRSVLISATVTGQIDVRTTMGGPARAARSEH